MIGDILEEKHEFNIESKKKELARASFRFFCFSELIELGKILNESPIYVRGGTPKPDYEPTRSYSDVSEEWKNRFAHLPQFEAWCRIQADGQVKEHHIKTVKAKEPVKNHKDTKKRIIASSRKKYGLTRSKIDKLKNLHYSEFLL